MAVRRPGLILTICAGLLTTLSSLCSAQSVAVAAPGGRTDPVIRVAIDLEAEAFDRALPFDVPFFIAGEAPAAAVAVEVQYALATEHPASANLQWLPHDSFVWRSNGRAAADRLFLVFVRTPLEANRRYLFRFSIVQQGSLTRSIIAEGQTASANHASVDVGMLYAGDIGASALFVGTNLYFRPVNRNAPLGALDNLGRRLAATVGVTISPVADRAGMTRSDLFWTQSLVLGGGYRLSSFLRGGGGALVFLESAANPLVGRKALAATWYASLSLDLDVAAFFR